MIAGIDCLGQSWVFVQRYQLQVHAEVVNNSSSTTRVITYLPVVQEHAGWPTERAGTSGFGCVTRVETYNSSSLVPRLLFQVLRIYCAKCSELFSKQIPNRTGLPTADCSI